MAVKKVVVRLGQSKEEGTGTITDLPAGLRGPQANSFIWNDDNNAIETLNVDGAGPNLPNCNTAHTAGTFGPNLKFADLLKVDWGEVYTFQYSVSGTALGPSSSVRSWNVEDNDLWADFKTRFLRFVAKLALAGHTPDVRFVTWTQGETDAALDGNQIAYYGLWDRLKREIRNFLKPYTTLAEVKFIVGLPSTAKNFLYGAQTIGSVRLALMKAGWADNSYVVVDEDVFSLLPDALHMNSAGTLAYSEAQYNASKLTINNTMALEKYTLKSIRESARSEFGIDDTQANNAIIDARINKALLWINNSKKNWPWNERETNIFVGERTISLLSPFVADRWGSALFSKNSVTGGNLTSKNTPITTREIVTFVSDADTNDIGLLVAASTASSIQLVQPYPGDSQVCTILSITPGVTTLITLTSLVSQEGGTVTLPTNVATFSVDLATNQLTGPALSLNGVFTATRVSNTAFTIPVDTSGRTYAPAGLAKIAREFKVAQSYFELPEDYIINTTGYLDTKVIDNKIYYKTPQDFERILRETFIATGVYKYYTVCNDPLRISGNRFIRLYPYFTGVDVIHIVYYGQGRKLVADDDEPDLPITDRDTLLWAAWWFVAQWQSDARLIQYKDNAITALQGMKQEYQYSTDSTERATESGSDPTIAQGPGGFPEFEV